MDMPAHLRLITRCCTASELPKFHRPYFLRLPAEETVGFGGDSWTSWRAVGNAKYASWPPPPRAAESVRVVSLQFVDESMERVLNIDDIVEVAVIVADFELQQH
jgi:hypothetical protein